MLHMRWMDRRTVQSRVWVWRQQEVDEVLMAWSRSEMLLSTPLHPSHRPCQHAKQLNDAELSLRYTSQHLTAVAQCDYLMVMVCSSATRSLRANDGEDRSGG